VAPTSCIGFDVAMPTDGRTPDPAAIRLICLVHPARAGSLLPTLRRHFASEPHVAVLVERRAVPRTHGSWEPLPSGQRRAPVAERALPAELRREAHHLRLVQPMASLDRTHEDTDLAALIGATLALEPAATSEFWWRVAPRVLARLERRVGSVPAEDAARVLLGHILDELPGFDATQVPLNAWLDEVTDRFPAAGAPQPDDREDDLARRRAA
jgi:hypothetical protein